MDSRQPNKHASIYSTGYVLACLVAQLLLIALAVHIQPCLLMYICVNISLSCDHTMLYMHVHVSKCKVLCMMRVRVCSGVQHTLRDVIIARAAAQMALWPWTPA